MEKTEARIQQECVMWFNNKFPELRGLLFEVNNNSDGVSSKWLLEKLKWLMKNLSYSSITKIISEIKSEMAKQGGKHKSLGRQKGVSDTILLCPFSNAVCIEFKTPNGAQSADQKKWEKTVNKHGHDYVIVRSLEEFQSLIYNLVK